MPQYLGVNMPQYLGVYKGMRMCLICEFVPSLLGPHIGVDKGVDKGLGSPGAERRGSNGVTARLLSIIIYG